MPSILPGFEYDIFISYRQNDNQSGWVTEFVRALQQELAAAIKEPVSLYFDTNPHDGLLETDSVEKSLEGKLKCLIFIPVISQTYCDLNSFAWQNEFCAFNKLAGNDHFGRDIKLKNGNVASRILPVKIHEIDAADKTLVENESGVALRAVEFIYKSPGVNRPLKLHDIRAENLNHLLYSDQVNKLANAIKEIILALKTKSPAVGQVSIAKSGPGVVAVKPRMRKILALTSLAVLIVLLAGYFLVNYTSVASRFYPEPLNKSVAVLPFENLSSDPNQEYFSLGMMDEVLNHLYKIGSLKVTSRTSAMAYKGTTKGMKQISEELGVAYLLEGSVQKNENQIRIIVQLIDGKTDKHVWSETYDREFKDVFGIQSDVAQQVASILKIKIDPDLKRRIEVLPTQNTEAYDLLLRARASSLGDEKVRLLEKTISLDPNFAEAYSALAEYWIYRGAYFGDLEGEEVIRRALPLVQKALDINPDLASGHRNLALISLYYKWDFDQTELEYRKIRELYPSNTDDISYLIDFLLATGRFQEALDLTTRAFQIDKKNVGNLALSYFFNSQIQKSLDVLDKTEGPWVYRMRIQVYVGRYEPCLRTFELMKSLGSPRSLRELRSSAALGFSAIAHYEMGQTSSAKILLDTLIERGKRSAVGSPSFYAAEYYTVIGEKDQALRFLENAYRHHEAEMYWIKVEPLFRELHGEPRFQALVEKVFVSNKN